MSNKPLVSVIVNCFNGEKYLEECLNSIINQTYQNWELIFWDNHSTDNSKKIFEKFEDKRLKYYLSSKHTFLYEARDQAVKMSKGEFLAFCDVDDFWSKEKLECLIPLFLDKKVGIAYSNVWLLNNTNKKKRKYINNELPKGNLKFHIIKHSPVTILAAVIRKSEYYNLKTGFNKNYQIIGDFDFFVRISKNIKFDCIQKPLVFYRLHDENFTKKNRDIEVKELEVWFEEMKNVDSFFSKEELDLINEKILYRKIMILILKKNLFSSIIKILKFPNNIKKIKLFVALLLPNFILRRIKEF
mgnify:CR=1 FL=1|tara:strand:- start:10175 stop:11074 length:900 start_codon:yes stop_codon:yes gene_type:complete